MASRRQVDSGPSSHSPSWDWVGVRAARSLEDRFDATLFEDFSTVPDAAIAAIVKIQPPREFVEALRLQGSRIVYIPIDRYQSPEAVNADTWFLSACDLAAQRAVATVYRTPLAADRPCRARIDLRGRTARRLPAGRVERAVRSLPVPAVVRTGSRPDKPVWLVPVFSSPDRPVATPLGAWGVAVLEKAVGSASTELVRPRLGDRRCRSINRDVDIARPIPAGPTPEEKQDGEHDQDTDYDAKDGGTSGVFGHHHTPSLQGRVRDRQDRGRDQGQRYKGGCP